MNSFAGWQKHLHLAKESNWGELPGSPVYLYLPYAEYDVAVRPETTQAELFTGLRQRRHHRVNKATLSGSLTCPLYASHVADKSLAQHLLEWLTSAPATLDLDSFAAEIYQADTDNKRHLGLRPSSGVVTGSADGGVIDLTLQLEGKREEGSISPPAVDANAPAPVEFLFRDCVFSLDSVELPLQAFSLRIDNGVRVHHNNSYWPSLISAGVREVSFEFTLLKTDDVFDVMKRIPPADAAAQLVLKGAHNGTGPSGTNYTTVAFHFARLAFRDVVDEASGLHELQRQRPQFVVLKPDSSTSELSVTYSAVA